MPSFNSRAREGRDGALGISASFLCSFNSRAREGRDAAAEGVFREWEVSIHAPVRGATYGWGWW